MLKKKAIVVFVLSMVLLLALSVSAMAVDDLDSFPEAVDPQSWSVPENMTWEDWKDNPVSDWMDEELPDARAGSYTHLDVYKRQWVSLLSQ